LPDPLQVAHDQLTGTTRVGLPWPSLVAFVRAATHPRVLEHPLDPDAAWRVVQGWLAFDTDFARFTEARWINPLAD
jgi:hypothetical protein